MKHIILPTLLVAVILTSCSTAYKSGQTPDDLYYAQGKVKTYENVRYEQQSTYEENNIRMSVRDYRWRTLDDSYDYTCNYNPYLYGYNYGYYYNPYYYSYPVYTGGVTFVNPKNTAIRTTNLNSYNNALTVYTPSKAGGSVRTGAPRTYNPSNTIEVRTPSNNETRVYTPARNSSTNSSSSGSSNSSSHSSNSSTGTSVPRPARGN